MTSVVQDASPEEVLALWQRLTEEAGGEWSEDGFGFFQALADKPASIAAALHPVPHGSEIADRVKSLIAAADDPDCAYFVIRRPPPLEPAQAHDLAAAHLRSYTELAAAMNDTELVDLLRACAPAVAPEKGSEIDRVTAVAVDRIGDYLGECAPALAFALEEAFYSMACDYQLVWYLTWPWYRSHVGLRDPIAPYFALWRHGLRPVLHHIGAPPTLHRMH